MYPSDGSDAQTLTKNADMAMYLAKEDGKNGFRFFTKEIKDAVDRASDAGNGVASCAGAQPVRAALSAEGGHGDRADHRRRGAVALDPSRARHIAAGAIHSACRGNRADRSDRPLGVEGSLRAKHGLAAPRIAADIDGGQSLAAAVRRRASVAGHRRRVVGKRHVAGAAAARGHRKHGDAQRFPGGQGA